MDIKLFNESCYDVLKKLEPNSIDMVLTDPPYGNMNGFNGIDWDDGLDWGLVFVELERICKHNANIVLFSQDHMTIQLTKNNHSNIAYCHRLIWDKGKASNILGSKKNPVYHTEDILVFRKQYDTTINSAIREYAREVLKFIGKTSKEIERDFGNRSAEHFFRTETSQHTCCSRDTYLKLIDMYKIDKMDCFLSYEDVKELEIKSPIKFNIPEGLNYLPNIITGRDSKAKKFHPTEKPVGLLEQLLKIYSNPHDTILDFTMGSGSTGVACRVVDRSFIGIELNKEYFNIAEERINCVLL